MGFSLKASKTTGREKNWKQGFESTFRVLTIYMIGKTENSEWKIERFAAFLGQASENMA